MDQETEDRIRKLEERVAELEGKTKFTFQLERMAEICGGADKIPDHTGTADTYSAGFTDPDSGETTKTLLAHGRCPGDCPRCALVIIVETELALDNGPDTAVNSRAFDHASTISSTLSTITVPARTHPAIRIPVRPPGE